MIAFLSKLITPYTTYPEIAAVHFINISCSALMLINIYIIGQLFLSPLMAFLLSLLVASNQIYILYSLGVTSEIIYGFFMTLALIIYSRKQEPLSYFILGLLFLLRYESIVIPISILMIEYFYLKKQFKITNIAVAFLPIILWLFILNYHSYGNSLVDNAYLVEIWQNYKKIPNLLSFQSIIEAITFEPSFYTPFKYVFIYLILFLAIFGAAIKPSKPITRSLYLIFVFHLLFLYLFPNFNVRYYLPIIWIAYLIVINHSSKIVSFTIIVCLLTYNLGRVNAPSLYSLPKEKLEYRLVADWFNSHKFDNKIKVLVYEPWILKYFVINPQVEVIDIRETPFASCKGDLKCTASVITTSNPYINLRYYLYPESPSKLSPETNTTNNTPIYVVTTSSANQPLKPDDDQFTPKIHYIDSYNNLLISQDKKSFKYVDSVDDSEHWANIFLYTP